MYKNLTKSLVITSILLVTGGAPSAFSDTLNGGTLTTWNPNRLYSLSSYVPGLYYWNNGSGDGPEANIGWCIVGSSQCGSQSVPGYNPPGYMPYYSNGGLGAPSNMYFTSNGSPAQVTLQVALTSQKGGTVGVDFFGYYLTDSTGSTVSNPTAFYTSNNPTGTSFTIPAMAAGQNYGFFIENVQGFGTAFQTEYIYYMNSASNLGTGTMPVDNTQHFAVFSNGGTYYLGAKDADACAGAYQPGSSPCVPYSEFDFNDIVIELNTSTQPPISHMLLAGTTDLSQTPEPGSASLFAVGLIGAAALIRRRTSR